MQAVQVQHYIQRATDFLEGMQLTRADQSYWNSSALLAIHSAVSFTDALRTGLGDQELPDDHKKAVVALQRLLPAKRLEDQTGFRHLQYLISKKNLVAYNNQRLERTDYEALFTKAERFAKWANNVGRRLNVKGWHHGE
jgi:hypothetical protein